MGKGERGGQSRRTLQHKMLMGDFAMDDFRRFSPPLRFLPFCIRMHRPLPRSPTTVREAHRTEAFLREKKRERSRKVDGMGGNEAVEQENHADSMHVPCAKRYK